MSEKVLENLISVKETITVSLCKEPGPANFPKQTYDQNSDFIKYFKIYVGSADTCDQKKNLTHSKI